MERGQKKEKTSGDIRNRHLQISKIEVTRLTSRPRRQLSECVNDSFYTYLERALLDFWTFGPYHVIYIDLLWVFALFVTEKDMQLKYKMLV